MIVSHETMSFGKQSCFLNVALTSTNNTQIRVKFSISASSSESRINFQFLNIGLISFRGFAAVSDTKGKIPVLNHYIKLLGPVFISLVSRRNPQKETGLM